MSERKVPTGRLGRIARLALTSVRSGTGLLLSLDSATAAEKAAEVLGTMRGLAAKAGQMASYMDGLLPPEHQRAYETTMKALRAAAPRSSAQEIRRLVESQLGAPLDRLYAQWHDEPIASASIGQVHRAQLHDGQEVAVKVQHPGIVQAVESDLQNVGMFEGLINLAGGRRLAASAMLDTIRSRFREELDYGLEAERMGAFGALHAGDAGIHVPQVVAERTSRAVLTMELCSGLDFDAACAADPAERRAWAETLWRFVFRGTLVGAMFNADPHPGNYLFREDGRVVFLDFGCVQQIPPDQQQLARRVHRAAIERDVEAFLQAGVLLIGARPGLLREPALRYMRSCFEPLFASPFRITRPYVASLMEPMQELGRLALRAPAEEIFTMPPDMLFMNRLQFGFYSVLARLDAEVDYAAVERCILPPA